VENKNQTMGNSIPITSVPRPTDSRAIIYIEPRGILGKLAVRRDSDEIVPSALDGTVPVCIFGSALDRIAERCRSFRGVYFSSAKSFRFFILI
jgi:hypothetical protein